MAEYSPMCKDRTSVRICKWTTSSKTDLWCGLVGKDLENKQNFLTQLLIHNNIGHW